MAIGTQRPRPHLASNMPRGGLGRLLAWRFEKGILAGVVAVVCVYGVVRLANPLSGLISVGYAILVIWVSRPAYPVTVLGRRRTLRFGHYLTKEEQGWIAQELHAFMDEIGRPVKRSLYRS